MRTCYVCQHEITSKVTPHSRQMGMWKYRHQNCFPGSQKWARYFEALPKRQRTEAGKILYQFATH